MFRRWRRRRRAIACVQKHCIDINQDDGGERASLCGLFIAVAIFSIVASLTMVIVHSEWFGIVLVGGFASAYRSWLIWHWPRIPVCTRYHYLSPEAQQRLEDLAENIRALERMKKGDPDDEVVTSELAESLAMFKSIWLVPTPEEREVARLEAERERERQEAADIEFEGTREANRFGVNAMRQQRIRMVQDDVDDTRIDNELYYGQHPDEDPELQVGDGN